MKLSPQKEKIVSVLRDLKWHCGSEWLNGIKDDRKRISELNSEYMRTKGYFIEGTNCKGRACGRIECPLFMRRAVKAEFPTQVVHDPKRCEMCIQNKINVKNF